MPFRLTPLSDATPEAFVVADPAEFPLSVKLMLLPLTPEPPDMSVADRLTVPPYVSVAELTASDLEAADVTVNERSLLWLLLNVPVGVPLPGVSDVTDPRNVTELPKGLGFVPAVWVMVVVVPTLSVNVVVAVPDVPVALAV